ncbi:acyltransferase [Pontibacterium sp. N1Y112]|uniref:Acyltransferase n=1 Tax=Pontibacterium sinense TaxID=2781979 RepID=A0A8J7FGC9_9GAMM|nr:acyltransferase [Pontibacterium sinense]MBE9399139.1 acyltransferase [Pontibacterium sinense]
MDKDVSTVPHPTIHSIQYLRAVAALMVVFHHLIIQVDVYEAVLHSISVGAAGVDVFFVISGFVIWFVTYNKNMGAAEFFTKRVIRVVPIYWLITLVIAGAATAAPHLFKTTQFELTQLLQSLLFIPHYSLGLPGNVYPILVPGWTLNYEMFFYLVFGCLLVVPRQALLILLVAFIALVGAGFVMEPQNAILKTYTSGLLLEFVAGVFIAKAYTDGKLRRLPPLFGMVLLVLGTIGLLLTAEVNPFGPLRALYWGVPGVLMVLGVVIVEVNGRMFKSRALHLLGDASYSIYLTHILALGVYRMLWSKLVTPEATLLQMSAFVVGGLLVTIVGGLIFHIVVEKPLTRFLQQRLIKRKPVSVQSDQPA